MTSARGIPDLRGARQGDSLVPVMPARPAGRASIVPRGSACAHSRFARRGPAGAPGRVRGRDRT